jgi:hypothetical protein
VVTGEYDGAADFPDRPWNLLAVVNAIVGAVFVHVPVMFADLSTVPPENITTTVNSVGGTTTSYLFPTERLPLVQLFPSLAPMEALLKGWVDAGYSRNDQAAVTRSAATDLTTEAAVESFTRTVDPTVGELTEPVDASAQAGQGPANATDGLVKTTDESPANATDGLVKTTAEAPPNATDGLAKTTAEAPAQADMGLDTATEAVSTKVTDLTDGHKVSPSTTAGTTQSSSGWKPGAGIRAAAGAIQRLFSGNTASTSTTTGAPTSDTSTKTDSETSSSTSSSSGSSTP